MTFHVVYTRHYLVNTPNWDATDAKHRGFGPDLLGSMLSDYTLGPASNEKTKEQAAKKNCFRAAKGYGIRNIFFFAPWSDHRIYISPNKLLSLSVGTFCRSHSIAQNYRSLDIFPKTVFKQSKQCWSNEARPKVYLQWKHISFGCTILVTCYSVTCGMCCSSFQLRTKSTKQNYLVENMIAALTFTFTSLFGSHFWLGSFAKSLSSAKVKHKILVVNWNVMIKIQSRTGC